MPQPNIPVSGSQFTLPCKKEIVITRNGSFSDDGQLIVTDLKNKILLKVVARDSIFHLQRLVLDSNGKPIMILRNKLRTMHTRWQAFKGESRSRKNLLFSAKKTSIFQETMDVSVFLAKNKKESVYDYKVTGDWWTKSCKVYAQEGTGIVAQMHKKQTVTRKDAFCVTVYPNVDYSYIVALIVILGEINSDDGVYGGDSHCLVEAVVEVEEAKKMGIGAAVEFVEEAKKMGIGAAVEFVQEAKTMGIGAAVEFVQEAKKMGIGAAEEFVHGDGVDVGGHHCVGVEVTEEDEDEDEAGEEEEDDEDEAEEDEDEAGEEEDDEDEAEEDEDEDEEDDYDEEDEDDYEEEDDEEEDNDYEVEEDDYYYEEEW